MTVQELIEELQKVEDKGVEVLIEPPQNPRMLESVLRVDQRPWVDCVVLRNKAA